MLWKLAPVVDDTVGPYTFAGTLPHSHSVGVHAPNASTFTLPTRFGPTMTCFTLLLLGLTLIQVPSNAPTGFGGTGLACAGTAKPRTTAAIAAPPTIRVRCLDTFISGFVLL